MKTVPATIQHVRNAGLWLEVRCNACSRVSHIPGKLLPKRLISDLPCHLAAAFYRCSGCDSKDLTSKEVDAVHGHGYYDLKGGKKVA